MQRDDINPVSDDGLDRLIRDALQSNVDEPARARLERFWRDQSRRQVERRRARRAVSFAAAALVVIVASVVVWNRRDGVPPVQAVHQPSSRGAPEPVKPLLVDDAIAPGNSLSAGRTPTAYERLMFAARTGTNLPAISVRAAIDDAVGKLVSDPQAGGQQVFSSSGLSRGDAEAELLRRLPKARDEERTAILELLAICGTPRSMPQLLQLSGDETIREAALATIEQIVGIEQLADVVPTSADHRVREALILRLLSAESNSALLGYLSLLQHDSTRAQALAIADTMPDLPVARLMTSLDHDDQSVRFAAAMVLGHVNGPEITQLLIARVTKQPADSTEAWMALMACRGAVAEEFFAYATRRPQLLGHVNTARVRWAQMIP